MAKRKTASFETLLTETEELVERLEAGELSLDESLEKYEKGIRNLRACARLLQAAEEKVKVLVEEAEGAFGLADLDTDALNDEEEEAEEE